MKEMKTSTKGADISDVVDTFLHFMECQWDHCVGICMDGAPSMTGYLKRFVTRAKAKNPRIISTHCFLHREALMTETMNEDFHATLNDAVHVVNYVKGRPLKSRTLAAICESMASDFSWLLYHTEVRWLSRGKVLARLYEMKEEIMLFLMALSLIHISEPTRPY